MGERFTPRDVWPRHSKPWFRNALDYARANGWHYETLSDHSVGKTFCRPDVPDGERCFFPIFGTGTAGESAAKELERKVDRCPHRDRDEAPTGQEAKLLKAERLVRRSEILLEAARRCLREEDLRENARTLFEAAIANSAESERLIEEAATLEREAQELASEGLPEAELVADEGVDWSSAGNLIGTVVTRVAEAEKVVRPITNRPEKRDLLRRIAAVREAVTMLRSSLVPD